MDEAAAEEQGQAQGVGPLYYRNGGIQPIEFILANPHLGFCEGNVVKYLYRWRYKGGVKDLKKARHYLDLMIEKVDA